MKNVINKTSVFILFTVTMLFISPAWSTSCSEVVDAHLTAQKRTAQLFKTDASVFFIALCQEQSPPIFQLFYTQMHEPNKNGSQVPISSFSPLKQPINPNVKSRSTGFMAMVLDQADSYTVKMRARLASGEAVDLAKTFVLKAGDSMQFSGQGMTVGVARLPQETAKK